MLPSLLLLRVCWKCDLSRGDNFLNATRLGALAVCAVFAVAALGCQESDNGRQFLSIGTAPVGGTFPVVGGAIAEVLNQHRGENNWKAQIKGSKGSQANIRRLANGQFELGMSNSAISFFAYRGESSWEIEGKYEVRAVCTLAPLVAQFITKVDSGIQSLSDLQGKRVVIGPAGAGFEMFVRPILEEHGVPWDSFTPLFQPQGVAVDLLGDGQAAAIFLGGAVPHPMVSRAMTTYDVKFLPYDDAARQSLVQKYPFFQPHTIPVELRGRPTYPHMSDPFEAMNVGSMQLVTHADTDEELVYQITKTLYQSQNDPPSDGSDEEPRKAFSQKHPVGNALNRMNAARFTGIPFHPGAIRFYQSRSEIRAGAWERTPAAVDGDGSPAS
jgi:TRAP transporter TAXI family solute receptor